MSGKLKIPGLRMIMIMLLLFSSGFAFQNQDSVRIEHPKRNALIQALGIDLGIWAWDRYVRQEPWAKITWKSVRNNIENGWYYDNNSFHGNHFAHPYHGALVFTAARAQGLSFWQSVPYPLLSSFVWEMTLETESPSINDMINTPFNGIAFGEVMNRLSIIVLNEGGNFTREFLTLFLNPSLGLNRMMRNYPKVPKNPNRIQNYTGGLSVGGGGYFLNDRSKILPNQFIRFHIYYGSPYRPDKLKKPFDYFSFIGSLNFDDTRLDGELFSSGLLKYIRAHRSEAYSFQTALYKNYDYLNYEKFKVASSSIGLGVLQTMRLSEELELDNEIFTNLIFFGGSGGDSVDTPKREYYYGPGASAKILLRLRYRKTADIYIRLKRYIIFNIEDLKMSHYENINLLKAGLQYHVWNPVSFGLEYTLVSRRPVGSEIPETLQQQYILRGYLLYRFGRIEQN